MCPHRKRLSVLPIVGFLQHVANLQYTPPETVRELLRRAWAHNPLTTLKSSSSIGEGRPSVLGVFHTVVFWLHQNHPKTLALNVRWFAQVGYMQYLLKILFREVARPDRERLRPELSRRAVESYNSDSNYRFLYDKISDFLVESLKIDIWLLYSGEFWKISGSAAAWCPWPSLNSLLDYSTLLCESIAKGFFPRESDPSYAEMEEAHYSYIVRERLGNLLPRLRPREFLHRYRIDEDKVPERVPYFHMRSSHFFKAINELRELQWKRMDANLSKKGKLSNCLSVCDVSVSMDGTPMEVCVALGLLVSQLSEEPWRRNVLNFSKNPELHRIEGKTLQEKLAFDPSQIFPAQDNKCSASIMEKWERQRHASPPDRLRRRTWDAYSRPMRRFELRRWRLGQSNAPNT
ncbi:hypothetical protein CKAN_00738800 [Cinnamomum micranthum f. kanehirae]|uniref:Uncharacterized protein n=1 Tax=Cinnamomum micranthum f. kanehirae TaxID=337451 RepID=A0A3S3MLZ8_9MAGN|nr:hypothetical protein CKAN_00738800 [Cinnamomum micranthum f. kanehirae]